MVRRDGLGALAGGLVVVAIGLGALAAGSLLGSAGCGGPAFVAAEAGAPVDGSTEGAVDGSPSPEGGPGDGGKEACVVVPPTSETTFCTDFGSYLTRCGYCAPCNQADETNCAKTAGGLSEQFKTAISNCVDHVACSNTNDFVGSAVSDSCVLGELLLEATQLPTAVASSKAAYCASCGKTSPGCTSFFSTPDGGGGTCMGLPLGVAVLLVSDPVRTDVMTTCTQANNDCDPCSYLTCALSELCLYTGPTECASGYCIP